MVRGFIRVDNLLRLISECEESPFFSVVVVVVVAFVECKISSAPTLVTVFLLLVLVLAVVLVMEFLFSFLSVRDFKVGLTATGFIGKPPSVTCGECDSTVGVVDIEVGVFGSEMDKESFFAEEGNCERGGDISLRCFCFLYAPEDVNEVEFEKDTGDDENEEKEEEEEEKEEEEEEEEENPVCDIKGKMSKGDAEEEDGVNSVDCKDAEGLDSDESKGGVEEMFKDER